MKNYIRISLLIANLVFAFALFSQNYEIWGAGSSNNGQLGIGSKTQYNLITNLNGVHGWRKLVAGNDYCVAIHANGSLWAWGKNNFGQLGDGTVVDRLSPVLINSNNDWIDVACGETHTLALRKDGSLWAWGKNNFGQLGDGTVVNSPTQKRIGADKDWVKVTTGIDHSLAIKKDGSLWAWGRNNRGQLGTYDNVLKRIPTQVGNDYDWKEIAAGNSFSLAIKSDNTLYSWGMNNNGQLGDGTNITSSYPKQVNNEADWKQISCLTNHVSAIKTDGTLWQWGINDFGQIGDGSEASVNRPFKVNDDIDWVKVVAGGHNTMALKSNGSLWVIGCDNIGQAGRGTMSSNYHYFAKVGSFANWNDIVVGYHFFIAVKGKLELTSFVTSSKLNNEICLGDSITLYPNINNGTPPYKYKWRYTNYYTIDTIANPVIYPKSNTKVILEVVDANLMKTTSNIDIKVIDIDVNINAPKFICGNETFNAKVSGATTYKWYKDSVYYLNVISSSPDLSQILLKNTKIIAEGRTSYCVEYDTIDVIITPLPKINTQNWIKSICPNTNLTYKLEDSLDYYYEWFIEGGKFDSTGSTAQVLNSGTKAINSNIVNVQWGAGPSGKIKLKATNKITGCSDSIVYTPIFNGKLNIALAGNDFCIGKESMISVTPNDASYKYIWNTGETTPEIKVNKAGIYKCEVTSPQGCSNIDSIEIKTIDLPQITINGDKAFCKNSSANIYLDGNFSSCTWSTGETNSNINIAKSGMYKVIAENSFGCQSMDSVFITEWDLPVLSITGDTTICSNSTALLTLQGGYASCTWSNGITSNSITVAKAGVYSAKAINANGCESSASFEVKEINNNIDYSKYTDLVLPKSFLKQKRHTEISIANLSVSDIKLKDGKYFILNRNGNNVIIESKSQEFGLQEDSLFITIDKPCYEVLDLKVSILIEGEQIAKFKVASIEALAGDVNVKLPILYELNENITLPDTINWDAKLSYIFPIFYPDIINNVTQANNNFEIYLRGKSILNSSNDTLSIIIGKTFLAGKTSTEVNLDELNFDKTYTVVKENGSIQLTGICAEPIRGIEFFTPNKLVFKPNPANSLINMDFLSDIKGEIEVSIYNELGIKVLNTHKLKSSEILNITFDNITLANGNYRVEVKHQNITLIRDVLIIQR